MNTSIPPPLQPGAVLAEQFELRALIGRGSTATVYRAWDRRRGAVVALKVASYEPGRAGPETAAHWEREAGLLERLDTPHIVRFYGLYDDAPLAEPVLSRWSTSRANRSRRAWPATAH